MAKSDGKRGPLVLPSESRKPGTRGLGMKGSRHLYDTKRGIKRPSFGLEGSLGGNAG